MTLQKNIDRVINHFIEFSDFWYQEWNFDWNEARSRAWTQCVKLNYRSKYEVAINRVVQSDYYTNQHRIVRGALLALVAYDDASKYLDLSSEKLKMIIALSEHPAAILLLPAVIAFEKEVDNKPV